MRLTWTRKISPVPATWILIVATMALSFWMYRKSPETSWTGNIGLLSALLNTSTILSGVILANLRDRSLRVAFDRFQFWCLASGGMVVVFWSFTKDPLTSYILVQAIALFGYLATFRKLWRARGFSEPLFLWISVFLACLSAIYPAWARDDLFAQIFLVRAVPSTALMVFLIWRAKRTF